MQSPAINKWLYYFIILSCVWGLGYPHILSIPGYVLFGVLMVTVGAFKWRVLVSAKAVIFGVLFGLFNIIISNNWFSSIYGVLVVSFVYLLAGVIKRNGDKRNQGQIDQTCASAVNVALLISSFALVLDYITKNSGQSFYLFRSEIFPAGLFPEPSHFGYSIGPLIGYTVLSRSRKDKVLAIIAFLLGAICAPSASLVVGFVVALIVRVLYRYQILTFIFVLIATIVNYLGLDYAVEVFDKYNINKSISWEIWRIGYGKASIIMQDNPFGVGPFGWIDQSGSDLGDVGNLYNYNIRDLASIIPFLIASYGLVAFPLYFLAAYILIRHVRRSGGNCIVGVLGISFLVVHQFRWAGVLLSPLLGFVVIRISDMISDGGRPSSRF